jgi:signal transduction histidine kinase
VAEGKLREAHDQLEKRVAERTLHLSREISVRAETEKKLVLAKRTAEAADRVKSEFLANMSHELRTPLNAVIGFAGTMEEEVFGPLGNDKYKEYVGNIRESGEHLLAIIGDILDVSMVEYGKLELKDDKVGLATLAEASIVLVKQRAEQGGVRIINTVGMDTPMLMADKQRVKQILVNLLSNAVKFTPEGGEVKISAGQDGNKGLTVIVQDTGIGMNEEEQELALMKFGRVESSLSGKYEGSGLGLPLVKDLMKAHNGTLEINSTPGKGTTVTVRFPAERVIG